MHTSTSLSNLHTAVLKLVNVPTENSNCKVMLPVSHSVGFEASDYIIFNT